MAGFPKGLVLIDAVLLVFRFANSAIGSFFKSVGGVIKKIPLVGGILAMPFNAVGAFFISFKLVLTILLIVALVLTAFFLVRWLLSKREFGKLKKEAAIAKQERKIEQIREGKGAGERLGNLAEDAARTGVESVRKLTSFLP